MPRIETTASQILTRRIKCLTIECHLLRRHIWAQGEIPKNPVAFDLSGQTRPANKNAEDGRQRCQ